ncbi:hypothetical protein Rhopal_007277-T1 [Rhodotorula paludigena]|uniref:Mediator of RNA polymerase II transcription subunit 11 n=1 Tax=Rhodotorula paludigena TaxID=86838 RepID=A0AAV5GVE7_9BASI|nr:hypothetical protein Rhopal_007277-T1 [Rhodotorula paludigena]
MGVTARDSLNSLPAESGCSCELSSALSALYTRPRPTLAHPSPSAWLTAPSPAAPFAATTAALSPPPAPSPAAARATSTAAPTPRPVHRLANTALRPSAPASPASPAQPAPLAPAAAALPPAAGAPPTTLGGTSSAALQVTDPVVDARRAVALLEGADGAAEGLLDRVQRDVEALLDAYDNAFEPRKAAGAADSDAERGAELSRALASLDSLLALLSRSSVGGFVPPPPPSASSASLDPTEAALDSKLSAAHIERANERVQGLFKEVQRVKEGADIVKSALKG